MIYVSLFHGIGAVDVAWLPIGWKCAAYAEIEPFPIAVSKHHNPDIPNLGDVTKITDEQIAALGPIDLVVGGSPCQDLSVAGKRAGLAGERSGLFHEQMRIFHAARTFCGARWLLWENVPGAFSTHGGRDFGVVVGAMAGADLAVPECGWGTCGAAIGANGLVEWRVLDAQYVRVQSHPAAVPQRRRRVFALLDSGAWADRPPVLLEPEGLLGHPAPRREAGQGTAGRAARGLECGKSLRATDGGIDREDGHTLVCLSSGQANAEVAHGHAPTLNCLHEAPIVSQPVAFSCKDHGADAGEVSPTLRSMEFDGSHADGGGQVAVAFTTEQTPKFGGDVALTITKQSPTGGGQIQAVAHSPYAYGDYRDPMPGESSNDYWTRVEEHEKAHGINPATDRWQSPAVAFKASHFTRGKDGAPDNVAPPLSADADKGDQDTLLAAPWAFGWQNSSQQGASASASVTPTLDKSKFPGLGVGMQVRRLTPVECEKLQGFPPGYTAITVRGKPAADGPRYRALGNSMAVNVMRWIGERIAAVAQAQRERDAA